MDTEDFRAEIPRKILIVVGKLDLGGVEQHLLKTLPKLNQTGVFASVYTLRGGGRLDAQFERCGVKVGGPRFRLPGRLGLVPGGVGLLITLLCQRPDVVHFFLPEAYVVGGLLSRVSGARFHVMSRRSLNNYQRRYPWLPRVESWLHKRMDVIVGNSRAVISQLEQEGVERDKLMLLYNGLDVSPYRLDERKQKLRQGLDLEASSLVLITVANLIPYKGHRNLLDALSYVRDKLPSGWVILMAGRDDGAGAGTREPYTSAGSWLPCTLVGRTVGCPRSAGGGRHRDSTVPPGGILEQYFGGHGIGSSHDCARGRRKHRGGDKRGHRFSGAGQSTASTWGWPSVTWLMIRKDVVVWVMPRGNGYRVSSQSRGRWRNTVSCTPGSADVRKRARPPVNEQILRWVFGHVALRSVVTFVLRWIDFSAQKEVV